MNPHRTVRQPTPALAPRRRGAGYTIVELVTAMTIAAVLVSIGVPAMQSFLQNGRNSSQAASMVLILTYARNEALKRDIAAGIKVCPSVDGVNCDPGGNWANRWIVPDPVTPGNPPLQAGLPLSASNTIKEANGLLSVSFLPSGAATAAAKFTLCDARGAAYAREFEINLSGRIAASSTVGQSVSGGALACP